MTPLDNLTSAFECLWEAKVYTLRAAEGVDAEMKAKLLAAFNDVAAVRNRFEQLVIELQVKTQPAPVPHPG